MKESKPGDFYTLNPHYVKVDSMVGYLREKIERFCPCEELKYKNKWKASPS